ncbi:CYTH-like domain-containing protein [Paraphysoderma sedebokerense]|nr:CYTH-like domain-containing protein [Paraphysoderma sedebokerense]
MEIYSPKTPLDFRITISTEKPAPDPSSDVKPERFRKKDRISYKHALMKVDLTQVKAGNCDPVTSAPILNGTPPVTVTHELEVEFVKPSVTLKREKDKQLRKEHNVYLDMVNSFLNTVRLLAKRSVEG